MNPWHKKQLRSMYDPNTQGYWFSVIDLCAILTDSDYQTARGYWKQLKYRLTKGQLVIKYHQLKFEAIDSKYYFTEVVDFKNLIHLVINCPSPKANIYRLWLVDMFFAGVATAELELELAKLGEETAEQIAEKYKYEGYVRLTVERKSLLNE